MQALPPTFWIFGFLFCPLPPCLFSSMLGCFNNIYSSIFISPASLFFSFFPPSPVPWGKPSYPHFPPTPSVLPPTPHPAFSLSLPFTSQASLHPFCRMDTMLALSHAAGRPQPWTNSITGAVSMPPSTIVRSQRGVNTHVWAQWIVLLCLRHNPSSTPCPSELCCPLFPQLRTTCYNFSKLFTSFFHLFFIFNLPVSVFFMLGEGRMLLST